MAKIAVNASTLAESTIADHINYTKSEQTGTSQPTCPYGYMNPNGTCGYYSGSGYWVDMWIAGSPIMQDVPYKTSAKINGTCTSTNTTVKINGKAPIVVGDKTKETDTYTIPSGGTNPSGYHTDITTGSVTVGNTKNVFVGGKSIAINGSKVKTHAGNDATITGALSTTVNIGT